METTRPSHAHGTSLDDIYYSADSELGQLDLGKVDIEREEIVILSSSSDSLQMLNKVKLVKKMKKSVKTIRKERKNREKQIKKACGIGGWATTFWEMFMSIGSQ